MIWHSKASTQRPIPHLEHSILDELEGDNGCPLLCQQLAVWGHAAGADAAYVCVVPPAGHEEHHTPLAEHRGDDCDVWQVTASSQLRVVGQQHITLLQGRTACKQQ
jgi:hypothetical protein